MISVIYLSYALHSNVIHEQYVKWHVTVRSKFQSVHKVLLTLPFSSK